MNRPRNRISFRFSARARHAACLADVADGGFVAQWWDLDGEAGVCHRETATAESTSTQPLPTDDGRLLLLRNGIGRHQLVLCEPADADRTQSVTVEAQGLRLVPGGPMGTLALAVEAEAHGHTRVWQVRDTPLRLVRPVSLPGRTAGFFPLDTTGLRYAADLRRDGGCRPVTVDLADATWSPMPAPAEARVHRLLLSAPGSGLLLVASDRGGTLRIGRTSAGDPADVCFPAGFDSLDGAVLPLAADPSGERVALRVTKGAKADLVLYDVAEDRWSRTGLPSGALHPVAGWGEKGLRVVYSHPAHPTGIVTVPTGPTGVTGGATGAAPVSATTAPAATTTGAVLPAASGARTERFDTPDGDLEAVCLGDWRTSATVVVALHGGPEAAWELRFQPTLHRLIEAGAAVVAPNQRGSTGYGRAHSAAIHGAWGVPDLADIRGLVRTLTAHRSTGAEPPALHGVSYGAFLALLAVSADPSAWSRCAVVAPFLSAARLYEQAEAPTRALIDRHGHGTPPDDELGARDVWELAGRIRTPLLVVHGANDLTVPVEQSRLLRQRLIEVGRREHTDFDFLEVAGSGHSPLEEAGGAELARRLVAFLVSGGATAPPPTPDLMAAHAAV